MDSDPPLPELHEALLDEATLDQLFFDIRHAAELIGVSFKGGLQGHAVEGNGEDLLSQARRALSERSIVGVQLRYVHGGREWWDTLMCTTEGIRLVRIAPDFRDLSRG